MITPWVNEFLKAFDRWSMWFVAPCFLIFMIGIVVGFTPLWRWNPVLVITGLMGVFIGLAFTLAALVILSINYTEKR